MCSTKAFTVTFQSFAIILCIILAAQNTVASKLKKVEPDFRNYRLGRFLLSVPVEMKQASIKHVLNFTKFDEFKWEEQQEHKNERLALWEGRLAHVKAKHPPRGISETIIETMDFSHGSRWAQGVFYYGNSDNDLAGYWDVLLDGESVGVWLKMEGTVNRRDNMVQALKVLVQAYESPKNSHSRVQITGNGKYYFNYGMADLPFDYSEEVYTRFEGHPLDKYMKLSVEMEVVEEVEEASLSERLSAAMLANFAPGLSIDKIRTHKRKLAGLAGEEVVFKGTEDGDSNLSFSWRYPGKSDSAQEPEILIKMESNDGDLDKKLQLWDSVLESLKPL